MAERLPPPAWCLPLAALIVALAAIPVLMACLSQEDEINGARRIFQMERIIALTDARPSWVVVGLGTSLIKYAIRSDREFAAVAEAGGIAKSGYLRLTSPGALTEVDPEMQDVILRVRPDVLLIQENALFYSKEPHIADIGIEDMVKVANRWVRTVQLALVGKATSRYVTPKRVAAQEDAFNDALKVIDDEILARHRRVRHERQLDRPHPTLVQLMRRCHAGGTRVVILPMPVDPKWASVYADDAPRMQAQVDALINEGIAERLACPLVLATEDFYDLHHMRPAASLRYTTWLIGELARRRTP